MRAPVLFFIIFINTYLFSQEKISKGLDYLIPEVYNVNNALQNEKEILGYLNENLSTILSDKSGLNLEKVIKSTGALHYYFVQVYHEIPIYQTSVIATVSKDKTQIQQILVNTSNWPFFEKKSDVDVVFVDDRGLPTLAERIEIHKDELGVHKEVIAIDGLILHERELSYHFSDTTIAVKVFNPDPLTSGGYTYGGLYTDNNDLNSSWLDNQLLGTTVKATFDNGSFILKNDFINMVDLGSPNDIPPTNTTPQFYYTRDNQHFEYVNAYYHLTKMRSYIDALGFNSANHSVDVDAHFTTADNSFFAAANPPKLHFGDGGIDDAEDADVVIHEYGHCISFYSNNNSNTGTERRSIDEALADYIAASYSKSLTSFENGKVFNWDGNNGSWQGRSVISNKKFPQDATGNIYNDAQIMSAALWGSLLEIGKGKMDSIVFQSMYLMGPNLSLLQGAQQVVEADTIIFQGENFCPIYRNMFEHGLMPFIQGNLCGVQSNISNSFKTNSIGFVSYSNSFSILTNERKSPFTVNIYTYDGKIIDSFRNSDLLQIDYNNPLLSTGVYIVQVQYDFTHETFKWVKSR